MEKIIYIPFLIIFLAGLLIMSFTRSPENYASISYGMKNGGTEADLTTGKEVMLSVEMGEGESLDSDQLSKAYFWDVKGPRGERFHVYQLAPLFTFYEIGRYIVDTYQPNGRLIATDTLNVSEGEYIDFALEQESIIEGENALAINRSTYKNTDHEWVVLTEKGNELFLDDSDTLNFASPDPGYYTIMLRLFHEGDTIDSKKGLTVNKKQVARVEKPKPKPKVKSTPVFVPSSKPAAPAKPKVVEKASEGWYKSTGSSGQFELGPPIPTKNTKNFSGGTVILELTPKTDLQLSEFSFWGNHNTGNYSILYECTTCSDESQKRLNPFVYRTGNDYYESQSRRLDSKRIGFKGGHTYKLTFVTQEKTEMQFEKLSKSKYENSNLTLEFITDRSSIFGLTFKTR